MKLGHEQDLALKEEVKRYDNAVQPLEARNENLEYEVADLNNELCRMNDKIIQLKQDIAVTEANTELFREVHLSAYNKMIKIKEIIGC
jgi:predicted  nucleic acid-binding Zn-ribbon protein